MTTYQYPIVGMRFRPPATEVVNALWVNCRLQLMAEPMNPYDSNAIAVWVDLDSAYSNEQSHKKLSKIRNSNFVGQKFFQLGYLPKEVAAHLRRRGFPTGHEVDAKFYYTFGSNVPHAKFDFEEQNGQNGQQ